MKTKSLFTPPLTEECVLGPEAQMCNSISTGIQAFSPESEDESLDPFNY